MHYIRHTLLAALLLSSLATQAQEYTPAQLQAFTQVFWEMKNNTQRTDQIESVPGISNDRLGEIIRAQATGQGVVLTPSEVIAVDNYKSRIDEYHDSRLSTLDSLCSDNNIEAYVYNDILKLYRSDIDFQRSLKPYFKTYFEGNE